MSKYEAKPNWTRRRAKRTRSAADLRQRAESADLHLQQLVLLGFVGERVVEQRLEPCARAKWRAQIDFVISKEARAQPAVGRQSHAVARRAVGVSHRRDKAKRL